MAKDTHALSIDEAFESIVLYDKDGRQIIMPRSDETDDSDEVIPAQSQDLGTADGSDLE